LKPQPQQADADRDLPPAFPARTYLRFEPRTTVLRAALGLTVYLAEPELWAREGASALLRAFLDLSPASALRYFTTSMVMEWRRIGQSGSDGPRAVLDALAVGVMEKRVRHLFEVRLCDDPDAPTVGFRYREIDPAREDRTGYLEIILPIDHDANDLLQLALEIGQRWPFASGVGGYVVSWNELEQPTAFAMMLPWCCRYLGLDVQRPEVMAWHAMRGLPGTSWLNMIGAPLAATRPADAAALASRPFTHEVRVMTLGRGTLVRAGATPLLGDMNGLVYPHVYAEAARACRPFLLDKPPPFPPPFTEDEATERWYRRLVQPEGWI
jgi:hypothetical protein